MKSHVLVLICMCVTLAVAIPFAVSQDVPDKPPLYKPTGNEPVLMGTITVTGDIPAPRDLDMSADPVCGEINNYKGQTEFLITNGNKVQNVFIYLESGQNLKDYSFEMPEGEAVLQHKNCFYSPRLLAMRLGQTLRVEMLDKAEHNTHPIPKLNREWNRTTPPGAPPILVNFDRAEALIPFKDNQHPWERAFVSVLTHPFFAISDKLGNFEIRGIPSGTYTLRVWHERLGEQKMELTLMPGEQRRADFSFKSKLESWEKKLTPKG